MAVLEEKFALKRKFLFYIHPLKSITNDSSQKECWIEQMKYLIKDFQVLLSLPFKEFWSTVFFNQQATKGLHSFLEEAAPPHLMDQFTKDADVLNIYYEIDNFAYMLLKRLTTSFENENNSMSSQFMWKLLCDKNIINIPMLFDISSIYGKLYKKELKVMFKELLSYQKLYCDNLKNCIQLTINCLNQFQDQIELDLQYYVHPYRSNTNSTEIEETNLFMIEDIINFLLDTAYSISNFLEIFFVTSSIFYQEKLHLKIASFYHSSVPLIYKKVIFINKFEQFQEKLHALRLLLVKSVQQCLNHLTEQITNKNSENVIEEYLDVITELLDYNEFLGDYNFVYNLTKDIHKCQKVNKEIDSTRYDYLIKSLKLITAPNYELKRKELQEERLELQIRNKNLENVKLKSLISDVKDVLPHLRDGFIQKCLEYYEMNSEKVINMVLEDSLSPELTVYDFNLPAILEDNIVGNNDTSVIKGNKKLQKLKAVLDDKTFRNEMRTFYEKYILTEATCAELNSYLDNEYDNISSEVEYVKPKPLDANEKRRPDVVPRVLIKNKVVTKHEEEEEVSNDEQQKPLNFQPFCENPEEVRERQARKHAAKQLNRSHRSKPKVSVSSASTSRSNVELGRQRKNENKASRGNHNRRNAARNKQQKGMF